MVIPLLGCATGRVVPFVQLAIDPMVQSDAPVQIVSIKPAGDNLLATVTVKNMTDRPVMDFDIAGPSSDLQIAPVVLPRAFSTWAASVNQPMLNLVALKPCHPEHSEEVVLFCRMNNLSLLFFRCRGNRC